MAADHRGHVFGNPAVGALGVTGQFFAPITIAPVSREVVTATAGQKLTIPLVHTRRSEFSGATMKMKVLGAGFESTPAFDVALTADKSQAVLDLAALRTPPGDYLIAFALPETP